MQLFDSSFLEGSQERQRESLQLEMPLCNIECDEFDDKCDNANREMSPVEYQNKW